MLNYLDDCCVVFAKLLTAVPNPQELDFKNVRETDREVRVRGWPLKLKPTSNVAIPLDLGAVCR